jgi:hypothetical protein
MSALVGFAAQAEEEGLTLVRCAHSASGFRCVSVKSSNAGRFYPLSVKSTSKRRVLGAWCHTPEEAALVVARDRGWEVGTKCDCFQCKAAACPPVAAPPTKSEVEQQATAEGLTLAQADGCSGYKNIQWRGGPRICFIIGYKKLAALRSASTNFVEPPSSFATGHEAALALARLLGPTRSAEEAVVTKPLTAEEVATRLMQTDNGEAFGGLFGGWMCVGYLTPTPTPTPTPTSTPTPIPLPLTPNPCPYIPLTRCEACFYEHPNSTECGLLYRSPSLATEGGRACCVGGWPADKEKCERLMGTDPVAKDDRGYGGRRFVWEGGGDEGGSSSDAEPGSYVHHCLFEGCGHKVKGFGRRGYCGEKVDGHLAAVYRHERTAHGDMPMTKEEVEDACCKQLVWGIAVVHTCAKHPRAFRAFHGLAPAVPEAPPPPS